MVFMTTPTYQGVFTIYDCRTAIIEINKNIIFQRLAIPLEFIKDVNTYQGQGRLLVKIIQYYITEKVLPQVTL